MFSSRPWAWMDWSQTDGLIDDNTRSVQTDINRIQSRVERHWDSTYYYWKWQSA